jgi:recombination protein RecR
VFPKSLKNLIDQFITLPGVGPKTAERLAISMIARPKVKIDEFITALSSIKDIKVCSICNNFSDINPCAICADEKRLQKIICVVATSTDLETIESTKKYNGSYHILGGLIDPIAGITPDRLFIKELVNRIKNNDVDELILAFDANIQGEATTTYLKNILAGFNIKITRLARGIPMGSDIEYTDEITLSSALENRREVK